MVKAKPNEDSAPPNVNNTKTITKAEKCFQSNEYKINRKLRLKSVNSKPIIIKIKLLFDWHNTLKPHHKRKRQIKIIFPINGKYWVGGKIVSNLVFVNNIFLLVFITNKEKYMICVSFE